MPARLFVSIFAECCLWRIAHAGGGYNVADENLHVNHAAAMIVPTNTPLDDVPGEMVGGHDQAGIIDVTAARRVFQRSAADSAGADVLSREVERRMLERLQYIRLQPSRILDAGSGAAPALSLLAQCYPRADLHALDAACNVLSPARAARPLAARARDFFTRRASHYVCGDFAQLPFATRSFQLIWSNLALAWAVDPLPVFKEFCRVLDIGGLLMFSTYGPDTLKELRAAFASADSYAHTHRFIDMHDLGDMLVAAGFAEPVMDMESITLTYADFDALARDLRMSGQSNVARGRRRGLLGRQAYGRMRAAYDDLRRDGRLPATVEIVYGHAWRVAPRLSDDGRSIIKLDLKSRS